MRGNVRDGHRGLVASVLRVDANPSAEPVRVADIKDLRHVRQRRVHLLQQREVAADPVLVLSLSYEAGGHNRRGGVLAAPEPGDNPSIGKQLDGGVGAVRGLAVDAGIVPGEEVRVGRGESVRDGRHIRLDGHRKRQLGDGSGIVQVRANRTIGHQRHGRKAFESVREREALRKLNSRPVQESAPRCPV